ncbi:type I polyketide synthase [Pseudonocardia spinosispora]|uniref:type I polyketide synthase n=1 Tax=Pseudonocardia spinosispora TaxID=103441 RepID=UPI000427E79D|nr:type I polyketide synthase [Pseudonocardia spinosispora]
MTPTSDIAIVGIGCRLPGGVTDQESLWRLLTDGVDAIGPVPADRWDVDRFYSPRSQQPGRMNAREAGFLDAIDGFDAAFFGISGRVAEQMDPQQRLLLEVAWEALEDAGIVPDRLAGGDTGVFVGGCSQDYGGLQTAPGELEGLGPHSATGTFMSILSNRLSYTFDLRGPSMTIDTACSSSLVAVHLAAQSLRRGESGLAIAGGVNLMLTPQFPIALSQASMLSPDARSRAFDSRANGYVRGEGAGVIVLKPLAQALEDRDRVYAVIRGSAVNQDGRTQGITLPSGTAQAANFRDALAEAGVTGAEVGYVEAHGTGTPVGDPIEANALGEVLSVRREHLGYLGSIKTNIGHLEAGAGIAGLIKAAISVHRREIPPTLHYRAPNPAIDFDSWNLAVPTETLPWPEHYAMPIAAVNSFGFGGTNANVVIAAPPPVSDLGCSGSPNHSRVLTLSARSEVGLARLAEAFADKLDAEPDVDLERLGAHLALRRSHHNHRLSVLAGDAAAGLRAFADGRPSPSVTAGVVRKKQGKVAFLFNGQGPQWWAMGRQLLETSPVYREKILECDRLARKYLGWSIYEELIADEQSSHVQSTYCLQPTMFALQVALAELWRAHGVVPDGVLGHSMGEIAAAHVSGSLDLDTALEVICHRSRIQETADPTGAMMFVALSEPEAAALCAQHPDDMWISARNSPRASTLSGRREVLDRVAEQLTEQGVFARILKVNCACHSSDMDPLRDELVDILADVRGGPSRLPMYSTMTGALVEGTELSTEYWWRNFRQPVLFEPGIRAMIADGFDTFIELSPHPVLGNSLGEILTDAGLDGVVLTSLSRKKQDWDSFLGAFGVLYTSGGHIDWTLPYPGGAAAVELPTNRWVHESYWNESEVSRRYRAGGQAHPMLKAVDSVRPTWEIRWSDHRLSWVGGHDIFGSVIVPGASYVEAALVAARELTGESCALAYVSFERACVLPAEEHQLSRLELNPDDGTFEVHHRSVRGANWTRAVRGRFHRDPVSEPRSFSLDEIRGRCDRSFSATQVYGTFRTKGYHYGPAFCGIERLYAGTGEALAKISIPRTLRRTAADYLFHPAVLDAFFQSAILHPTSDDPGELLPYAYLPTGIENIRLHGDPSTATWCYSSARKFDESGLSVDIYVLDAAGEVVAEYTRLHGKVVPRTGVDAEERLEDHLYQLTWRADPAATEAPATSALTSTPSDIAASIDVSTFVDRLARADYAGAYQDDVRELCAAYTWACLSAFGQPLTPGSTFTPDDLADLVPRFHRVLRTYLRDLVTDGLLTEQDGTYTAVSDLGCQGNPNHSRELWARALTRHPSCVWELLLLRKTGERLHEVLTGVLDPLHLLFPEGSQDETEPIYQSSPIARLYNQLAREAVRRFVETADPRRTLRILEVGGGTGGLTANVLPVLPADRCEYVFTDVSPAFAHAAQERFAAYPNLSTQVLDLEHDPVEQGLLAGTFDMVLASDVLHATSDLKKTLLQISELLAPGGVLGLIEAMPGNRFLDMTFGLTTGWWSGRDLALRPDGPLLDVPGWRAALTSVGYDQVAALADPGHEGPGSQTLLLAAVGSHPAEHVAQPAAEPGDWLILADPGDALGAQLVALITDQGGRATLTSEADLPDLAATTGVVTIVGRTQSGDRPDAETLVTHGTNACLTLTNLLRTLAESNPDTWPRLYTITQGAHTLSTPTHPLTPASRGSQHTESGASAHREVCSHPQLGVPTSPTRAGSAPAFSASRASEHGESGDPAHEQVCSDSRLGVPASPTRAGSAPASSASRASEHGESGDSAHEQVCSNPQLGVPTSPTRVGSAPASSASRASQHSESGTSAPRVGDSVSASRDIQQGESGDSSARVGTSAATGQSLGATGRSLGVTSHRAGLTETATHPDENPDSPGAGVVAGGPVWGFATVAGLEFPQARLTMIDLAAEPEPDDARHVWDVLRAPTAERELAIRAGQRFVRRLTPLPAKDVVPPVRATELAADAGYALELRSPGELAELHFAETRRPAPQPSEVEVEVRAAGLNFLDVMTALGQVPPLESSSEFRFGAEAAGVVTRVGAESSLKIGDQVMVVHSAQGTLASHVTLDARCVVAKPERLSFEEAASVPIVFLTAWYALEELARIRSGDRVLIHSAAGGTGLAAIQIALRAGAEVFATAGTEEKRSLLTELGVHHVMDSRSLRFVDDIHHATDGHGVDVVLNSIAGDVAARTLDCLAPYGRFVEIGKRDLLDNRKLGLRPFLRNLSYFSFDLRQLLVDRPEQVRATLNHLSELFAGGQLRPLPYRVWQPSQTEAAFRQMAAARHIGKLVIAMDERDVDVRPLPRPMQPAGTWLITGGFGGLGLAMADALATEGVRNLVLLGRSGPASDEAKQTLELLRDRGVTVTAEAVDITDRAALSEVVDRVGTGLRGVLHCAMVLDDALVTELDEPRMARAIRPKALGAWHLHELTAHLPLDAFVLFSSATSMIGNIGQANYGAANAFLDHLAQLRRHQGLPALAINFGAVSDAGYVARNAEVARLVGAAGLRDFTAAQAYRVMRLLLTGQHPNTGVLPMDWSTFFARHGFDADTQPRYAPLYEAWSGETIGAAAGGTLAQQLRAHTGDARDELLRAGLKARVSTVLGMPLSDLDDDKPLMDYLDSLLAVEICAWLERELGAKVTIMELMKGPSVAQLAERLLGEMAA